MTPTGLRAREHFGARRSPRARLLLAVVVTFMLSGGGCFEKEEGDPFYGRVVVPARQELRWSDGGLPRVFDPAIAAFPPDTDAVRAMFEGLTDYDPVTLEPVPAIALRWESGEDGRSWTFHLRTDARWSNGDPVTAHDFVRSWKRALQLGDRAPHSGLMRNIEGAKRLDPARADEPETSTPEGEGRDAAESSPSDAASPSPTPASFGASALDDHTLSVRLVRPDKHFPALASHPVFRPVHELGAYADVMVNAAFRKDSGDELEDSLITNGAFRLTKRAGGNVVLERAASYWDAARINLERVHFVAQESAEDALAAYRAGEVDAVTNAAFEPLALKLLAPYKDFRRETFGALTFYQFNTSRRPYNDLRVRQALAHALDLERLSADVLGGATVAAGKFLPSPEGAGVAAGVGREEARAAPFRYDPARARALLAEAGYPGGEGFPTVRVLVNRNEQQRLLAHALAGMWRSTLNVRTEVIVKAWDDYEASRLDGDFDVVRRSIVMQTLDEETNMLAMFGAASTADAQAGQAQGARSEAAEGTPPPAGEPAPPDASTAVAPPNISTEEDALRELPAIPIFFATSFALVKPYVAGFDTNLLDAPSLKHVRVDTNWSPPKEKAVGVLGGE